MAGINSKICHKSDKSNEPFLKKYIARTEKAYSSPQLRNNPKIWRRMEVSRQTGRERAILLEQYIPKYRTQPEAANQIRCQHRIEWAYVHVFIPNIPFFFNTFCLLKLYTYIFIYYFLKIYFSLKNFIFSNFYATLWPPSLITAINILCNI